MSSKLSAIQGLRGLSILGVFMSHWYAGASSSGMLTPDQAAALAWLNLGKYGVELFFMISGFVILGSLKRHASGTTFAIDRIARIYPAFLALHGVVFFAGPFVNYRLLSGISLNEWLDLFWTNALLLPGVFSLPIAQTVAWSLSYELLFYILAALTYSCLVRRSKSMAVLIACCGGAMFAWWHPRALFFLPGILAYFAQGKGTVRWRLPDFLALGSLVAYLWLWSLIEPEDGKTLMQAAQASTPPGLGLLASLTCGGVFFFHVLLGGNRISSFCSLPALVRLGDISYSFYLLHVIVMFPVKRITTTWIQPHAGDWATFMSFGILSFAITLLLSLWSRRWLEVKAGDATRRWLTNLRLASIQPRR